LGNAILSGMIELTNGMGMLCQWEMTKLNIAIISFLIGFGGLSVLFQVYGIIAEEKISMKPYLYGKFLQGIFSFGITLLFIINL